MLYLRLVMDHIFVLCSNSLSDAEEPPCSVTLIRRSKSSPISFYLDLYGEESRWWDDKELEEEEERGIGRLTWLTSVAGGPRIYSGLCQTLLEQTYRTFKRRLPISAVKHSLFTGLSLCQIEPVCLDGPSTSIVFSLWTFAIPCSAQLAEKEQVLSNCKALKVIMCVWKMGHGASFILDLNCNL